MRQRRFLLALALLSTAAVAPAPAQEATPSSAIERIDEYFDRLTRFGFSGSVLIGSTEGVELARGYGLANRETERPFLPSTVVTIGSITKPLTAMVILALQERGLLDIEDRLADHLAEVPTDKAGITLAQLLSHTSGLQRNGLDGGDFNREATRERVLQLALGSELLSAPGTAHRYSNLGYTLLAIVAEEATGRSYQDLLFELVLDPARMYRTGYDGAGYADTELAFGYRETDRLEPVVRQPALDDGPTWNLRGNGGIHSIPFDMYPLVPRRAGRGDSVERVGRSHDPSMGRAAGSGRLLRSRPRDREPPPAGTRDLSHAGGNGYFAADLHWYPDDGRMVFLATNEDAAVNIGRLSSTVESILFGRDVPLPPFLVEEPERVLASRAGTYGLEGDQRMTVVVEDGRLVAAGRSDHAIQLLLGGERTLTDGGVRTLAERSVAAVESEFRGDFEPKFEAMRGAVAIADLERYHGYDRETWDEIFGELQAVETVAAAGAQDEVRVVVRMRFARGAAGQIHTWRAGRLANISILPDWRSFELRRTLYPTGSGHYMSFDQSSPLGVAVAFGPPSGGLTLQTPDGPVRLEIGGAPGSR